MEVVESQTVCSVKKEDQEDFYRIHITWMFDKFRINIASKNGAWSGEMTPESIQQFCGSLQLDKDKYLADCKEALSADDGKKGYSYAVENGCFVWKKIIDEDSGMKVKMGSVMLQPVSFTDTLQNIIEVSLKQKKNLKQQIDNLVMNKEDDSQRINDLQKKVEELIDKKNIIEEDLYTKCLLLLNAKKRKIEELEQALYNLKAKAEPKKDGEETQNSDNHASSKIFNPFDMETEDENDEDSEINTQSVKCPVKKPFKRKVDCLKKNETKKTSSQTDLNAKEAAAANTHNNDIAGKCDTNPEKAPEEKNSDPGSSTGENVNDAKTSIPASKEDILDFFFG